MTDEQKPQSTGSTSPTRGASLGWPAYLALCALGLIAVLTSLEPSASEGFGPLGALLFWTVHVVPALLLLTLTQIALGRIARISTLPGIGQVLLTAVVAAMLFTPVALGIDTVIGGPEAADSAEETLLANLVTELGHFFVPLVLIWTLINAPSLLQLEGAGLSKPVPDTPSPTVTGRPDTAPAAEFWSRIPGRLGRDLVALSAELHYLRVRTTEGETLILFPFGRAVETLQDVNGMQVHRSHWVALDQIDEVTSQDGRTQCQMIDGTVIPVSRSYRAALKAARKAAL